MAKKEKSTIKLNDFSALEALKEQLAAQQGTPPTERDEAIAKREAYAEYHTETYQVVSAFAFLIGVNKKHFEDPHESPQLETYQQLMENKNARIIRYFCMIRNAMMINYKKIVPAFLYDGKNIGSLPDLIPTEAVDGLYQDQVRLHMSLPRIEEYLILINQELSNRIGTVQAVFPDWVKWAYIKPLFLMPSGMKVNGVKGAINFFRMDWNRYPYQCYLNWDAIATGPEGHGNVLLNDEKFVDLLYARHEDHFENRSLVKDVGRETMRNLTRLLTFCGSCVIAVDCENSDPVKLAAALSSLPLAHRHKIKNILLFDSNYTSPEWARVEHFFNLVRRESLMGGEDEDWLRFERIPVARLNESKSLVDPYLIARVCQEVYANFVDAVILASSDGDYWAMIQQMEPKGVSFLVMVEHGKTSLAFKDQLAARSIPFCYLDDFSTNISYKLKTTTLIDAIQTRIDAILNGDEQGALNVKTIMEEYLRDSWLEMTEGEKHVFYNQYLTKIKLSVTDGKVSLTIPSV